jgi:hypothetical protein
LREVKEKVEDFKLIDRKALGDFFLSTSDLKDCKLKQEVNAYIQGKIDVVRALS